MTFRKGSFNEFVESFGYKITDNTINGQCSCCGECCSNILPLTNKDISRLKKWVMKKTYYKPNTKANLLLNEKQIDMTCPFLNKDNKCDVYYIRPTICREFVCNKIPEHQVLNKILTNLRKEIFNEYF